MRDEEPGEPDPAATARDFDGEPRKNETHASATDAEATEPADRAFHRVGSINHSTGEV
jgi:hypothetical protein